MAKQNPTREGIIKAWKEVDAKSDKPVGATEVATAMGISPHWIWKLFAGNSLTDMKLQHGIRLSAQEKHRSDDDLFLILDGEVSKRQSIPGWNVLNQETGIPESTWKKRLGGRKGCSKEDVYRRYAEWLQAKTPKSSNLDIVRGFLQGPRLLEKTTAVDGSPASRWSRIPSYQKTNGRVFGRPLHFGNLTYEPTNEQGVVFLFGMVSKALGFDSIEYLGTDFPDCEGKRRVGNQRQLQHVRIEFEFKSSNFEHDPNGCDVIICWEHNWRDCPSLLEVIELKKEIKSLRERPELKL
jgi:hypothetical protein